MQPHLRRKLVAALTLTILLAISVGVIYVLWAATQPLYFYIALGTYAVLLVLALVFVGRRPATDEEIERDLQDYSALPDEVSPDTGMAREPVAVLETSEGLPLQVEKATGMLPTDETGETVQPYRLRGFTLYERQARTGTQRFFSKGKPVGGGTAIALPEGAQAKWDAKKKRPYLVEPEPAPAAPEPEFEVSRPVAKMPTGITARRAPAAGEPLVVADAKPCSAFESPGIMCSRPAREGSPYCRQHAGYRPDQVMQGFEVRRDTGRGAAPAIRARPSTFEVRTAKPQSKPLRIKEPTMQVETARPSTHPPIPAKGQRAKTVLTTSKPLKNIADRPFAVQTARGLPPPRTTTRGVAKKPAASSRGPSEVQVKLAKPAPPRAFRPAAAPEPNVRFAKPPAPKPLRVGAAPEPVVRPSPSLATTRPPRVSYAPEPVVRPAASLSNARPLRVGQAPEPVVRPTASLANAKPLYVKRAPEPVVRPTASLANARPLRGARVGEVEVETVEGPLVDSSQKLGQCKGLLRSGKRCGDRVQPGSPYCARHQPAIQRSEARVVRDTRRRSNAGVGDLDRRR